MFSSGDTRYIKFVLWACVFGIFVCGVGIGWGLK